MNRYERFDRMISEINKGRYPSIQDFCEMFEKKERTVHKDLAYLRDFLEMDIRFDKGRNGYYNPDPSKKLPEFNLSVGEVFALTVGSDMLAEYSGTAFEPAVRSGLEKIKSRLPEKIRIDLPDLVTAVRFKTTGIIPVAKSTFFDLNKACEDELIVNLQYASASQGQTTIREIEPLRLVENRGAWYLTAWCRMRNELRTFALHRIIEYKLLHEKFEERDIDVDKYINDAFLLEQGEPPQTYVIKFDAVTTRYIKERQWHASQELTEHADGSCILSFTATRLDEVKRWVLGYGASAEVIQPKELRAVLRKEFAAASAKYENDSVVTPMKPKKLAARTQKNGRASTNSSNGED